MEQQRWVPPAAALGATHSTIVLANQSEAIKASAGPEADASPFFRLALLANRNNNFKPR